MDSSYSFGALGEQSKPHCLPCANRGYFRQFFFMLFHLLPPPPLPSAGEVDTRFSFCALACLSLLVRMHDHACPSTCTPTYTRTHIHTHTHTHAHTYTRTPTYTCTRTYTHTHTYTCTRTYTHTRTCTHACSRTPTCLLRNDWRQ